MITHATKNWLENVAIKLSIVFRGLLKELRVNLGRGIRLAKDGNQKTNQKRPESVILTFYF